MRHDRERLDAKAPATATTGVGGYASRPYGRGAFAATLRDRIATELRSRVLSGVLTSGTWLDLDELAEEFGSSRTPVREALIQLSYDGLVEVLPRRGARVRGMTREEIRDNFLAFGALSGVVTARAVNNGGPELITRLRTIAEELEGAVENDEAERIIELNWMLHREIHRASGSQRLLTLLKQLARAIPIGYFEVVPTQGEISVSEHRKLIDAIDAGDAEVARVLAEGHVREAGDRLIADMEARGLWRNADDARE